MQQKALHWLIHQLRSFTAVACNFGVGNSHAGMRSAVMQRWHHMVNRAYCRGSTSLAVICQCLAFMANPIALCQMDKALSCFATSMCRSNCCIFLVSPLGAKRLDLCILSLPDWTNKICTAFVLGLNKQPNYLCIDCMLAVHFALSQSSLACTLYKSGH